MSINFELKLKKVRGRWFEFYRGYLCGLRPSTRPPVSPSYEIVRRPSEGQPDEQPQFNRRHVIQSNFVLKLKKGRGT